MLQLALDLPHLDVLHSRVAAVAEKRAGDVDVKELGDVM